MSCILLIRLSDAVNSLTENQYCILTVDRKMQLFTATFAAESMQNSKSLFCFSKSLTNVNSDLVTNYIFKTSR